MWMRTRIVAAGAVAVTALGLMIASGGCGILFFPVALPAAIGENRNVSLKGVLVDEQGKPVNDVLIHVEDQHVYWEPMMGQTTHDESKDVLRSGNFDFPWVRGSTVSFTFTKAGYRPRTIAMQDQGYEEETQFGRYWPKDTAARVILQDVNRSYPMLRMGTTVVTPVEGEAGGGAMPSRLLSDGANGAFLKNGEITAAAMGAAREGPAQLVFDFVLQPLKTKGADREVDVLDVGLPAKVVMRVAGGGGVGGFIQYVPVVGSDPFEQMTEAPAEGYMPEFALDAERLKAMRKAGKEYVLAGHAFFFIRAGTHFGKMAVAWGDRPSDAQTELKVTVAMQGDGTRDLAWRAAR